MRKLIQLVEFQGKVFGVCDDGTAWNAMWNDGITGWVRVPEIPQEPFRPVGQALPRRKEKDGQQ